MDVGVWRGGTKGVIVGERKAVIGLGVVPRSPTVASRGELVCP